MHAPDEVDADLMSLGDMCFTDTWKDVNCAVKKVRELLLISSCLPIAPLADFLKNKPVYLVQTKVVKGKELNLSSTVSCASRDELSFVCFSPSSALILDTSC